MKHCISSASLAAMIACALALGACATQPASPLPPDVAGQDTRASQAAQTAQAAPPIVGGDRDAHGCIGSAGYAWCERTQQCERPWELAKAQGFANSAQAYEQFCRSASSK
ncbi:MULTISPECIES: hypothetical protein [unclassified Burkholderia]|uniref:hypothetical protein n=1 Tax=unclassified Burkholderia TaxID=2613784 RepID=UPI000758EC20|nr:MULTISPECIES: hypothetical protein [unclassified Burkholderia]KUY89183.1 hypothetical protein WS48_28815 [Burkholderia sp. RF7-non_BP1]KUY94294.1 hypothetical protein WS49_24725 [Burkholderia sp. RF7-non_BP4]